jgi:hypothetical protein
MQKYKQRCYLDWLGIPIFWDFFREKVLLQLSLEEFGNELADAGLVDSTGLC